MRADLSPDDFQGLMQTHREQARLRSFSQTAIECKVSAREILDTVLVASLACSPVVAFLISLVI